MQSNNTVGTAVLRRFTASFQSESYMRTNPLFRLFAGSVLLAASGLSASAGLRLPAVISDHAIFQAGKPIAIWGWANAGDAITVTFRDDDGTTREFKAATGEEGRWSGQIPEMQRGATGQLHVTTAKGESLDVHDLITGEVWLCGGQSNMSYLVNTPSKNANERTTPELLLRAQNEATAAKGKLRYFATRHQHPETPLDDVQGSWIIATPDTVGGCFALSWNFAVELNDRMHAPVGLLDSAVGGTVVEAWTPKPELDACAAGPDLEKRYEDRLEKIPADKKAKFETELADWLKKYPSPELQQQNIATRPMPDAGNPNRPARLYNGMIHGLEPYTLAGVIWFQGDGNCPHPSDYGVLIKTLITSWRKHFHNDSLPFYYVEMQNYSRPQQKPVEPNALSEIRDQQQAALTLQNTDVATGVDVGIRVPNYEAHFPDKKALGKRLAGLALDHLYGQPGLVHSPCLKSFKVEGNKIRLQLSDADGLRLRGSEMTGFAIKAADGQWVWAKGEIEGQDILVWSDQIAKPSDVRYAWAYNPFISVENSAGLPLRPFRTDTGSAH